MEDWSKKEPRFRYMLLDRLRQDCDYYLRIGGSANCLWADSEKEQIQTMIDICKDRRKDYRNAPCNIKGISGYIPVSESIYDCDAAKKIIYEYVAKWKAEQAGL